MMSVSAHSTFCLLSVGQSLQKDECISAASASKRVSIGPACLPEGHVKIRGSYIIYMLFNDDAPGSALITFKL